MTMSTTTRPSATPAAPSRGKLQPLGLDEVRITGGFWARMQEVNAGRTLGHIEHWLEREGWLPNFDLATSGGLPQGRRGREFSDSEVYKWLEAMAWEIGRTGDEGLEARFRAVVARVAAAQCEDGYLNTQFGRPGQAPRWSDLRWGHELYVLGHLFQAAVARARTRPDADDGLLGVARRAADLVVEAFGPEGIDGICGHPVIEPALAELARVTGDERYLAQAELFVARRGRGTLGDIEWGRAYFQDDVPVRDATVLRGHAVRANYLAAGAVDVAVERKDEGLLDALERQWSATVARRTYVTGGQGSRHQDEAFGDDWMLPPDRAYSETCASVGSIMFAWRLLLATGRPRYADLIERTLFNVVATSPAHDGESFYYANTLQQRTPGLPAAGDQPSPRASSSLRAPWFEVSCCPPNVARTLASLASYAATVDDDGVQLHQFAPLEIRGALADGRAVELSVETEYPANGSVRVRVLGDSSSAWALSLRIPAWADGATLTVRAADGADVDVPAVTAGDYVSVRRAFAAGDVVELTLPTAPRVSWPDPRIDAVRGCVVVERGPEVLCLESVDLATASDGRWTDVGDVRLDATVPPREVDGRVSVRVHAGHAAEQPWPYGDTPAEARPDTFDVPLVPYHDWAERGPSTMRVWLPVD